MSCTPPPPTAVLSQGSRADPPAFDIFWESLEITNSSMYLESCISVGRGFGDDISLRVPKDRLTFASLGHLSYYCDIKLSLKGEVHRAPICLVTN